jgi:hypothetical protein
LARRPLVEAVVVVHVLQRHAEPRHGSVRAVDDIGQVEGGMAASAWEGLGVWFDGAGVARKCCAEISRAQDVDIGLTHLC